MTPRVRIFEEHRDTMYGIAYRMLGSLSDAEDVVQDAWFRWRGTDVHALESPGAYLATMISRMCIDRLRRRRIEKQNYVGPWLPEPLVTVADEPDASVSRAESISMAFLHVLENLSPLERGAFILKDVFDYSHDAIADALDIQPAHSRQLLRRARARLDKFDVAPTMSTEEDTRALLESFLDAVMNGEIEHLRTLLSEDVIALSDGGGRASAALIPLVGFEKVTTVLLHLVKNQETPLRFERAIVNGMPGTVAYQGDELHSVHTADVKDGKIVRIYSIRNPDKLHFVVH